MCPDYPEAFQFIRKVSKNISGRFGNCLASLETVHTVWKLSGQSGNCLDSLESVRTVWTFSRQCENCHESVETFRTIWTVWKLSGQSGNCPDSQKLFRQSEIFPECVQTFQTFLIARQTSGHSGNCPESSENIQTICKLYRDFRNWPDNLETVNTVWKPLGQSWNLLESIFVNKLWFTHFFFVWLNYNSRTFSRPESFCAGKPAIRKVFVFSASDPRYPRYYVSSINPRY